MHTLCHRRATVSVEAQRIYIMRSGSTLSEVLISLLIMSIGLVGLMSLFPISVLKTAKANQLTVGTNVRRNAEAMMEVYPYIFSDPDPTDTGPNGIPDGNQFNDYDFFQAGNFVFDPLGITVGQQLSATTAPAWPHSWGTLRRYAANFTDLVAPYDPDLAIRIAERLTLGTDAWTSRYENDIQAVTSRTADIVGLSFIALENPAAGFAIPRMRVILFYNGGLSSVTREITSVGTGNKLNWSEDVNGNNSPDPGEDINGNGTLDFNDLPVGITPQFARIESLDRKYTWLLTVRPQGFVASVGAKPNFDVDIVVFYNRTFTSTDEAVYGAPPPGFGPIANLVIGSTAAMRQGNRAFLMSWPSGAQPALKRGGYVFDCQNGHWYQIESYSNPEAGSSTVTLTSTIRDTSTLVSCPKGVIDVYPLQPKSPR